MPEINDDFEGGALDPRWARTCSGGGTLTLDNSALRLALPAGALAGRYSDAQIDDYTARRLRDYLWRPPLRLDVRARASHPITALHGTAGFGFWNYPLTLSGAAVRLPDAVWFFAASPPSNMALVPSVPGYGWKAQVVHAHTWRALAAGGPALAAVLAARLTGRERLASRWVARVTGAREAPLDADLRAWHDYSIEWLPQVARFFVDGREILTVPDPPRGPLGFVAWIDNQYAIATPRGQLRFGTLDTGPAWLELDYLRIIPNE